MSVVPLPHRVILGGAAVDLRQLDDVLASVTTVLTSQAQTDGAQSPLAIASANLDHIHHFGAGGVSSQWLDPDGRSPHWVVLLDGMPLVRRARTLTATRWPQLAGSDLLSPLLSLAATSGARVGFLGGLPTTHELLRGVLAQRFPGLTVAGTWAPTRDDLTDHEASAELVSEIRAAGVHLLVVGLGKPRQERWIQAHATDSGARVLLAFGASTDFLAGIVPRCPNWVRDRGLEWLYRLVREPRRLARRYLVQAPLALWRLRTRSRIPA